MDTVKELLAIVGEQIVHWDAHNYHVRIDSGEAIHWREHAAREGWEDIPSYVFHYIVASPNQWTLQTFYVLDDDAYLLMNKGRRHYFRVPFEWNRHNDTVIYHINKASELAKKEINQYIKC